MKFLAALLLALVQTVHAQSPILKASPTTTNSVAAWQDRLTQFIGQPRFAQARWGILIQSLTTGKTWFSHDPDRLMIPASNAKLFTGALALERLGADFRIKTSLLAQVPPGTNGTLNGDLVVYGRGDPTFSARYHNGDRTQSLQPLVKAITSAGIKRIKGDLVGDSSFFQSPPLGDGWAWDDLQWAYAPIVSALCLDDNATSIQVKPGLKDGDRCEVIVRAGGLTVENRTTTLPHGSSSTLEVRRLPGESEVHVTGGLPVGGGIYVDSLSVPNPPLWFVTELEHALALRGIVIDGKARLIEPRDAMASNRVEIAHVLSPPIREIVTETLKSSQNLGAQLLFLQTGALTSGSKRQSAERAAQAEMVQFLRGIGIKPGTAYLKEGSGLSSSCEVTPSATVALLSTMHGRSNAIVFHNALPIAGVDGTLADRFKGTTAEKRIWAKTGTKEFVSCISGYALPLGNEPLVFSIMLNGYKDPSGLHTPREETDAVVRMMLEPYP